MTPKTSQHPKKHLFSKLKEYLKAPSFLTETSTLTCAVLYMCTVDIIKA